MKVRTQFILAVTIVAFGIAVSVLAKSVARLPTSADVAGVYSGYGDGPEFLRLELDADGTGLLCISYLWNNPARLYRVERWQLHDRSVETQVDAIDVGAERITLRDLNYNWRGLEGELSGSGWKRKLVLYSEKQWQLRAEPTRERIDLYRKQK